jgi:hypothetical protein
MSQAYFAFIAAEVVSHLLLMEGEFIPANSYRLQHVGGG